MTARDYDKVSCNIKELDQHSLIRSIDNVSALLKNDIELPPEMLCNLHKELLRVMVVFGRLLISGINDDGRIVFQDIKKDSVFSENNN